MQAKFNIDSENLMEDPSRYIRQMNLKEIGFEGQQKISKSEVLVIGAGGIGSSVLMYLSAMGVGHIGIIDNDKGNRPGSAYSKWINRTCTVK